MGDAKRVLVTGASGLIGSALLPLLKANGYQVTRLVRSREAMQANTRYWKPSEDVIELPKTDEYEAVLHLGGANIGDQRLTERRKREVWNSRTKGTTVLCDALVKLEHKPRVLVCASAMGIYGNRGDEILTDNSAPGTGFLAELCVAWERAAEPARQAGIRVVHIRTALVLSAADGALKKMLPAFRLGVGGPLGNGQQWMSWITRKDVVRLYLHSIEQNELTGGVNAAAPDPVRQKEFARVLGRILHRPAVIPMPRFALQILFGKERVESLLSSTRLEPAKAVRSGFRYTYEDIEAGLRAALADKKI